MAIASPGKNWGFCSDECANVKDPFTYNVAYSGLGLMTYLPPGKCEELLGREFINSDKEFCGGNLVIDERRRFKLNDGTSFEEIEPLTSWKNLSYIGGMNMEASVCGVCNLAQHLCESHAT